MQICFVHSCQERKLNLTTTHPSNSSAVAGKANWGTGHNNRSTYIIMEEQWMMLNASYRAAQLLYEYIGTGLQYVSKVQVQVHGQSTDSHALLPK